MTSAITTLIHENERTLQIRNMCTHICHVYTVIDIIPISISFLFFSFKGNKQPHIYFPAIWFAVHGQMTEEGSSGLKMVLKLPQMFYITTIASMVCTLVLLSICACRSFRQNIFEQFSCVASDEESNNSNSTEDISIREPSEKDVFVSDIVKRV